MMYRYYANKNPQSDGVHEVHREGCSYMPSSQNQHYLGMYSNCHDAVEKASTYFSIVDGCFYCSRECHTR